jgi:hypothetical protein
VLAGAGHGVIWEFAALRRTPSAAR